MSSELSGKVTAWRAVQSLVSVVEDSQRDGDVQSFSRASRADCSTWAG